MGKPCAKPGLAGVSLARHGKLRIDKNWVAYFGLQLGHALWQKCVMGVAFLQEPESFLRYRTLRLAGVSKRGASLGNDTFY